MISYEITLRRTEEKNTPFIFEIGRNDDKETCYYKIEDIKKSSSDIDPVQTRLF